MPRPGIDWSTLHTLEERIAALVEDTDLTEYRLLVNPNDEKEAKRIVKAMRVDLQVSTNGAVEAGSPMLEGVPGQPRTTTSGIHQEQWDTADVARKMWQAMQDEGKTYPDYKGNRLPRTEWNKLEPVEQAVFTGAVRRLMLERVIYIGSKKQ